jgi:predicted PurR-regulated permease PerM
VIGLTLVAILAGVFIYFRSIVSMIILAFIITYLFQPIVKWLSEISSLSWRVSSTVIFLLVFILLIGLLTGAGFAIAQQLVGLVRLLQNVANDLPTLASDLSQTLEQYPAVGEYINLNDLANRVLETLQPLLGQAGTIVGSIATGAAVSIGRIFFVIFIAYFILAESQSVAEISIDQIPEYGYDFHRISRQLRIIWDSFFRGQFIIFTMVFVVYLFVLSALGVRYFLVIALMTGFSVFIPYLGLWVTNTILVLVTLLQPSNYFGLQPWIFSAMVLAIALIINLIFDNYISPRFLGRALDIHPAAVIVSALLMASLLGIVGIFLAAPVVATLKLIGIYVFRKMFDLDPWPDPEEETSPIEFPWFHWFRNFGKWISNQRSRIRKK